MAMLYDSDLNNWDRTPLILIDAPTLEVIENAILDAPFDHDWKQYNVQMSDCAHNLDFFKPAEASFMLNEMKDPAIRAVERGEAPFGRYFKARFPSTPALPHIKYGRCEVFGFHDGNDADYGSVAIKADRVLIGIPDTSSFMVTIYYTATNVCIYKHPDNPVLSNASMLLKHVHPPKICRIHPYLGFTQEAYDTDELVTTDTEVRMKRKQAMELLAYKSRLILKRFRREEDAAGSAGLSPGIGSTPLTD